MTVDLAALIGRTPPGQDLRLRQAYVVSVEGDGTATIRLGGDLATTGPEDNIAGVRALAPGPAAGDVVQVLQTGGALLIVGRVAGPGWVAPTLGNGWVNYDPATYVSAGYRKVGSVVHLRGLVKNGTIGQVTAFTLPAGHRPPLEMHLPAISNNAIGTINILPGGEVRLTAGSNLWFSLDGAYFFVD